MEHALVICSIIIIVATSSSYIVRILRKIANFINGQTSRSALALHRVVKQAYRLETIVIRT